MTLFTEISLLIGITTLVAVLARLLRQPLLTSYIITGLIVGPFVLDILAAEETIRLFGEIGIAFLLFLIGLDLTPKVIREVGRVSLIAGVGQVIFTTAVGYFIVLALGFNSLTAIYLSIGLAFSSTIIILKLLSDKGELQKLSSKISIGFLLVQDLIAIGLLFLVPLMGGGSMATGNVPRLIIQGFILVVVVFLVAHKILPRFNQFLARSPELLFLFATAWGLGLATLFRYFGFSLEGGALIAGVTLSALPSHIEIKARLKPLRDFFIILFFVLLGAQLNLSNIASVFWPAILLSLFVLIGNPIILMVIMGALGYRKRTSFEVGLSVAQISEFSLILIALGFSLGHVPAEALSLATLVGIITITISTYLIMYSESLYKKLASWLGIFERSKINEKETIDEKYEYLLFGYNRIGFNFLDIYRARKKSFLVVDFNPAVNQKLSRRGVKNVYGDAGDIEILENLGLASVKLAVSTIPDFTTNQLINRQLKKQNKRAFFICVAHQIREALDLYDEGVDYVVMPHFLGGLYAAETVKGFGLDRRRYAKNRLKEIKYLRNRERLGQDHPTRENYEKS
jgi:Kef-type K+ transport system membrane component KefB